jgi:flavodoxin
MLTYRNADDHQHPALGENFVDGGPSSSQVWESSTRVKSVAADEAFTGKMQDTSVQKPGRISGIVVFDTKFGNTEKIAKSIAVGLERAGVAVKCVNVGQTRPEALRDYDLLVVGAPTQAFTASKPMKEFIGNLEKVGGLTGKSFYAFDTRLPSRFSGSAAKYIESKLERLGLRPAGPRSSAIGRGSVFRLDDGEEKRFERIGLELGTNLSKSS